ncbi:ribosomal RNA small subunit methyltransferase A [Patescibacteria group bacterium]|nr:ribosomal RNA small subunit methyltransferase A [Patescibacteria group bacterium]
MNAIQIKKILKEHDLQLNKRLGQNFLIDNNILDKIIITANLSKQDTVLEIGSGLGTLTKELAQKAKKVITIEKDKKLTEILKQELKDYENVELIEADILRSDLCKGRTSKLKDYKVVSNLPYYITSPVIRMLLESDNPPQEMILMVQKEVAQRICAKPPKMNLLAVATQFYANPKIIFSVSKNSFWPRPKIDSAIIKIEVRHQQMSDLEKDSIKKFFQVVKAGFSSPRKQLANNLYTKLSIPREQIKKALAECGLPHQARAENLSVENWQKLIKEINA